MTNPEIITDPDMEVISIGDFVQLASQDPDEPGVFQGIFAGAVMGNRPVAFVMDISPLPDAPRVIQIDTRQTGLKKVPADVNLSEYPAVTRTLSQHRRAFLAIAQPKKTGTPARPPTHRPTDHGMHIH